MKKTFSFLFLILASRLWAVTPVPYTESVSFSFRITGVGNGMMSVYDEAGTTTVSQTTSNATTESNLAFAKLRPGKKYAVNFQASGPTQFWLSYIAPVGYALLINDIPQSITYQATAGGGYSYDYTMELRPIANYQADTLGNFSGIDLGKSISWDIGLGTTRSGRSAGRIMFKEKDLSTNPAGSRARLYYAAPGNYGEISVIKDGSSTQTLRQVSVPQGMVDIVDETSGYSFKFYTPAQIEWSPGNPAIMHGSPWKTIQVLFSGGVQTVTETEGSAVRVSELTASAGSDSVNYTWTLKEGTAATKIRTTINTSVKSLTSRDVISEVHTGSSVAGTLVSKTKFHYDDFPWGAEELTQLIADPDTAQLTTLYYYYTAAPASGDYNRGNYRQLRSVTSPTGNWTGYIRYDDWDKRGQIAYEFHPYQDSPAAPTNATALDPAAGRVAFYQYNSADWTGRYTRATLRQERINNIVSGQTTWTNGDIVGTGWPRESASVNSYRDANPANIQIDYTETYRGDSGFDDAGRPCVSKGANLVQTAYNSVTIAGNQYRELVVHGSTSSAGAVLVSTWNSQSFPPTYLVANKSTMDVTIRDLAGKTVRTESYVFTGGSSFSLLNSQDFTYDLAGRVTQSVANSGATVANTYTNGRLTSAIDAAGTETQFTYDELGRVLTSTKMGVAASGTYAIQGAITTTNTFDGAGHVTQTQSTGGALTLTTSNSYDYAGRLTSTTAPGSLTTGFVHSAGGRIVRTNFPGTAYKITEVCLDGQTKSVSGSAVIAENYGYGVDPSNGRRLCQSTFGGNTSAWTNVYWDWLGHKTEEWKPGWSANVVRIWSYNNNGQLFKFTQPGLADTLYTYDSLGILFQEGLDISAPYGSLDLASDDRITQKNWGIVSFDSGATWFRQSYDVVYATSGVGSGTIQSQDYERLNGFGSTLQSERYHYDIYANGTYSKTSVDRANKKVTITTTKPDSSTSATQTVYNGLPMDSTDTVGAKIQYGYDGLGRQVSSADRTGTSTTAYKSGSSLVDWVKDAAGVQQATYTYDTAGRVSTVTNADALGKVARYEYNDRNQKIHEWGDTTNPVEYVYDSLGRQTELHTYRAGTGWTGGGWPAGSVGTVDVTTWAFHAATGFLSSKTDAGGMVSFTYTQAGQVNTKTNARGIITTNTYSANTGELTNVAYTNDPSSTTALVYTYNRLGQPANVTDYTGPRTFNYNLGSTLELTSEVLSSFYSNRQLTYTYDTTGSGTKGRLTYFGLGTAANTTIDQWQAFGYQGDGRLATIGAFGYNNSSQAQTFGYSYLANSHLISQVYTGSNYSDVRNYNTQHDWITSRNTSVLAVPKAGFAYTQDTLGRIKDVTKTGELFTRYGTTIKGLKSTYGYTDRSEVNSDTTTDLVGPAPLTGRQDTYDFDSIGNRKNPAHNNKSKGYATNNLNQYTQTTVAAPGVFDVSGASPNATVTVNGSSAGVSRRGDYFFAEYSLAWGASPAYTTLTVADGTNTSFLPAFSPGITEDFKYDADGNLTSDGRWLYSYDAENRLIHMETKAAAAGAATPPQAFQMYYDYLGRRVKRQHFTGVWNGSGVTWNGTPSLEERFIYNGWNLIAEINGLTSTITRDFFWGLDLSGTSQGAGGVGGLLMTQGSFANAETGVTDTGKTLLAVYDAGGNLHGMLNTTAVSGANSTTYAAFSFVAAFEYDSSGKTIRESGPYAASNPFRYSTKYTDIETGLVYYGHRYYSPSLGRFINKDPIEEKGGLNLYGFCLNNGVNSYDLLGNVMIVKPPGERTAIVLDNRMTIFVGGDDTAGGRVGIISGYDVNNPVGHTPGDDYITGTAVWAPSSTSSGANSLGATWGNWGSSIGDGVLSGLFNDSNNSASPISPNASREHVIIHDTVFLGGDELTQYKPYVKSNSVTPMQNFPSFPIAHTPNNYDLLGAIYNDFGGRLRPALSTGRTVGILAPYAGAVLGAAPAIGGGAVALNAAVNTFVALGQNSLAPVVVGSMSFNQAVTVTGVLAPRVIGAVTTFAAPILARPEYIQGAVDFIDSTWGAPGLPTMNRAGAYSAGYTGLKLYVPGTENLP